MVGIFSGSSFVVIIGFFIMLPMAFLFAGLWPKVQAAMLMLQGFFKASGTIGWDFTRSARKSFCPRACIISSMPRLPWIQLWCLEESRRTGPFT